ncbi:MAG: hypothetical protein V1649_00630 [Patescibacteria group bacterium]
MNKFKSLKVLSIMLLTILLLFASFTFLKASAGRTVQTLKTLNDTLHVLGNLIVDGNVGIGTTNPGTHSLYVNGTGTFANNVGIGIISESGIRLKVQGIDATASNYALRVENAGLSSIIVARNDGNVGIGTETPGAKLDVNGTIRGSYEHFNCISLNETNPGPDYYIASCPAGMVVVNVFRATGVRPRLGITCCGRRQ